MPAYRKYTSIYNRSHSGSMLKMGRFFFHLARMVPIVVLAALANTLGVVVESGTDKYTLCSCLSVGGIGAVHTAVSEKLSGPTADCTSENLVVLKCGTVDQTGIFSLEARYMSTISSEPWAPRIHEYFKKKDGSGDPCIAMELLGLDLQRVRDGFAAGKEWSWVTLGSIGARMIEAIESLHNKYKLVHTDLHAGNWVLLRESGNKLSSDMKLIDYGDCRPLEGDQVQSRDFYSFEEMRQVIINIRYLFDGNLTFYAWKRYKFNKAEICAGIHPRLCEALVYVSKLKEGDFLDYKKLHRNMVSLVEESGAFKYENRIIWGPSETRLSQPEAQKPSIAPVPAKAGNVKQSDTHPFVSNSNNVETSPAAGLIIVALLFIIVI